MRLLLLLLLLILLCVSGPGCYVVRYNTVFPRVVWYWSDDAKQDRAEKRSIKAWEKANPAQTNSVAK